MRSTWGWSRICAKSDPPTSAGACVIDSQSVKITDSGRICGYDADRNSETQVRIQYRKVPPDAPNGHGLSNAHSNDSGDPDASQMTGKLKSLSISLHSTAYLRDVPQNVAKPKRLLNLALTLSGSPSRRSRQARVPQTCRCARREPDAPRPARATAMSVRRFAARPAR